MRALKAMAPLLAVWLERERSRPRRSLLPELRALVDVAREARLIGEGAGVGEAHARKGEL